MNTSTTPRLDPRAAVGPVSLIVRDRAASANWYRRALGLEVLAETERATVLGAADGAPLFTLVGDPDAVPAGNRQPGLFHAAVLLPRRADLGRWLKHANGIGLPLEGASDHLVSEAVYLSDPEGNGIEVYRDRPRTEWPRRNGKLQIANAPFDVQGVLAEADTEGGDYTGAPAGTVIGHVHLKVADLVDTRAFYEGLLGFEVTEEGFPSALFVAAGGYHHHLGLNTWRSAGGRRVPGTTGLDSFTVTLPTGAAASVTARLAAAGVAIDTRGGHPSAMDPSGNRLVLVEGDVDATTALQTAAA